MARQAGIWERPIKQQCVQTGLEKVTLLSLSISMQLRTALIMLRAIYVDG
jgi:hypothetical protein